ncbi:MAG: acyltransferase [Lachnospiraceae bacterium]|nr:acyltransferase [Lachnospiraceae bacterium]
MKNTLLTDNQTERYHSIDFLKGICIVFIIVTHYAWEDSERLRYLFPFWIDMAVPIFMIMSGFVYTKSFLKKDISTLEKAYSIRNILGKIIRYSVPFIIAFIIEMVVFNVSGVKHYNIWQIGKYFFRGGVGKGSYYYPIMIQFIFLFPIILLIVQKYDFNGVLICAFVNLSYEFLRRMYGMPVGEYRLLVFRYTLLISYGSYLAMGNYKRHTKLSRLSFFIGIMYIIVFCYMGYTPLITNFWTTTSMWACLYIIPISGSLIFNKKLCNKLIETIGKASYNIFLVQMVYYNGAKALYRIVQIKNRGGQLLMNIIICLSIGVLFYFVETPITKFVYNKAYRILDKYVKS